MARRTFEVIDVTKLLVHWHAQRSQAEIASSLGVDRKTVRKYTAPAIAAGMTPGGPPLSEQQWAELVRGWFPELVDSRLRQSSWPAIEAHHDYIKGLLGQVTVSTIHQRLRDEYGLQAAAAWSWTALTARCPARTSGRARPARRSPPAAARRTRAGPAAPAGPGSTATRVPPRGR